MDEFREQGKPRAFLCTNAATAETGRLALQDTRAVYDPAHVAVAYSPPANVKALLEIPVAPPQPAPSPA